MCVVCNVWLGRECCMQKAMVRAPARVALCNATTTTTNLIHTTSIYALLYYIIHYM